MEDFIGKYDGNQIDSRLDKVKDMVGATASGAGAAGLVPAPAKGDEGRFLCGDGTWKDAVAKSDDEDAFFSYHHTAYRRSIYYFASISI